MSEDEQARMKRRPVVDEMMGEARRVKPSPSPEEPVTSPEEPVTSLKVGQVVRLVSGGPCMTVHEIHTGAPYPDCDGVGTFIVCRWFVWSDVMAKASSVGSPTPWAELKEHSFAPSSLMLVVEHPANADQPVKARLTAVKARLTV
jgi:uncharacterized protein YodC (DUF2158 family)